MKKSQYILILSRAFILLSAGSIFLVSILAMVDPQKVMDLVQVNLPNTDAYSSIRGVYGGVGLTIFITLIYLLVKNPIQGLSFLVIFWGFYALSRVMTILMDGYLGDFGIQWLMIEFLFFLIGLTILTAHLITRKTNELLYIMTDK
ncbi:DUF4345 domain-containing protein [Fontibacter flavus]|uniref:DUF4345 domain-containing protein n=1 Tax=Fontibacter flavus TaxID=654838 RepID=A0ABV6FX88_9BACT